MPIPREDVLDRLASRDPDALRSIAELAGLDTNPSDTPRQLAQRITRQLWWSYATPLGLTARTITLDEIVDHVAERLRVQGALPAGTAWERLTAMTTLLTRPDGPGVSLDHLDAVTRQRLVRSW